MHVVKTLHRCPLSPMSPCARRKIVLRVFRSTNLRYLLVGIAAFILGSATIGAAAASSDLGSLFYTTILNDQPTQPCVTTTTGQGSTTVCNAIVDSNGNLHVTGTTSVSGPVNVGNFPATQTVSGTVNVGNLPPTQSVSGTVNVGNPNSQPVPVNVVAGSVGGGLAPASFTFEQLYSVSGNTEQTQILIPARNITLVDFITDCGDLFLHSGPIHATIAIHHGGNPVTFPQPIPIDSFDVFNGAGGTTCVADVVLIGS